MRKFDEDVAFLQRHGAKVKVLSRADGGRIAKTQSAVVLEKLIGQFLFDKAQAGGGK